MSATTSQMQSPITLRVTASSERVGAGLTVLRALPKPQLEAVGPFVFLDHFGPAVPPQGGVPAHPHAGIEVITYLIDGQNEHCDSFGHVGLIGAGGAQWIVSGRGMLHAETQRPGASGLTHGIQLWTRQSRELDDAAPTYEAVQADAVPQASFEGGKMRLLAGFMPIFFPAPGPIRLSEPAQLTHVTLDAGKWTMLPLPRDFEMAVYAIGGTTAINGETLSRGDLALLRFSPSVTVKNQGDSDQADFLLFGGARAERPLVFRGPFVFNSSKAIAKAEREYAEGRMGRLDGKPF